MPTPVVQGVPPRRMAARQPITLPIERISPVIRIAHQRRGGLDIPERIIFDHEFVLVLSGAGEVALRDGTIRYAEGDLLFIEPFRPHALTSDGVVEHVAVHFDFAGDVPGSADTPQARRPYEVRLPRGLRIPAQSSLSKGDVTARRVCEIVRLRDLGGELGELEARAKLVQVIVASLRGQEAEGDRSASVDPVNRVRIERAIAWASKNLHRDIGVADLADAAGLSPSHFNRLFTEWTGYAPMAYVRRRRVEEARVLLGDVDLTIKEIARRLGFRDPFHFSKVFRQIDGLPPSAFREALLAERADERE